MEQNLFSSEVHNKIIEKRTELLLRFKTNKHNVYTHHMIKLRSWKPNIVSAYMFKSVLSVDDRKLNAHHFLRYTLIHIISFHSLLI